MRIKYKIMPIVVVMAMFVTCIPVSAATIKISDGINLVQAVKEVYGNVNTDKQVIKDSKTMAILTSCCASVEPVGLISVNEAILNNKEEITLVTLGGTELNRDSYAGIKTDILSGFGLNNDYLNKVVSVFESGIVPQDKPVVVTGISLGGMVAQQLLSNQYIMKNFKIRNIVCFGSPLLCPMYRNDKIKIVRLCDKNDKIPKLSVSSLLLSNTRIIKQLDAKEKVVRDGGYKTTIDAHVLGYVYGNSWDGFDCLGIYNGGNTIEVLNSINYFK